MRSPFKRIRSLFSALSGQWLLMLLWPALGVIAVVGLWQFEQSREGRELSKMQVEALRNAESISRSYARQLASTLDKLDQLTAYIKHDWETSGGKVSLETLRQQGIFTTERLEMFTIIGADGHVKTSVFPFGAEDDFSDRPYFKRHKQQADNTLSIGEATMGRLSQQEVVHLTRRLNRPDGSFDGVIVAILRHDFFAPLSDDPAFGKQGFKALIDSSGDARFALIDTLLASAAQLQTLRSASCRATVQPVRLDASCFVDGQARYVATTALANYPFKAMVGLSEQEALLPMHGNARAGRDVVAAGGLLIAFFCLFAWLLTIDVHLRRKAESQIRMAYRLATENGKDGFYLWKRVRNRVGTVVDFRIVDCNERGANMYHHSRATLLGKTITDLYGNTPYRDIVVASGVQMDMDGEGESDYAVLPESTMTAKWLRLKYARTYEGIAVTLSDITERVLTHDELARRAMHDELTGLPNRYWLTKSLPAMLHRAAHNAEKLAVLFVDLNDFKVVNDTLGHSAGDTLLRAVAERLQALMRPGDRVARLGGDEFTVLLDKIDGEDQAAQVAARVVGAFNTPFSVNGTPARVGASIGIALFPQDGADSESLLKNADTAMYAAKSTRTGYRFFVDAESSIEGRWDEPVQSSA
jgi:diguanylate cyclase (GGDEF)-like protein